MVKVYAIALVVGVILMIAWIFATYLRGNVDGWRFDPEERFGKPGPRLIAGLMGFGLAGMSAEFSPFDLSWPGALTLAIAGAAALAWYAGWVDRTETEPPALESRSIARTIARTGNDQS